MHPGTITLKPLTTRGWQRGLSNLLGHELALWWGRRRWITKMLVWILLLNGTLAASKALMDLSPELSATPEAIYLNAMQAFFQIMSLLGSVGIIIAAQGTVIQEKQMGTAAWILSKPVSRPAFILAKAYAYALGVLVMYIGIPAVIFEGEMYWFTGSAPAPADLLAAAGIMSAALLFYLSLAIMIGTFTGSRGIVLGVCLGFLLAGSFLPGALPWIVPFFPWLLHGTALLVALGPLSPIAVTPSMFIPVIASLAWVIIFLALATWRFGREEF